MCHMHSIGRATGTPAGMTTHHVCAWVVLNKCMKGNVLFASLGHDYGTNGEVHEVHVQMAATRAASNSPVDELTTPSPFSGSRDDQGAQSAPQGGAIEEGSSEKKPFLRRRPRHMPVSQRCCCRLTKSFTCNSQCACSLACLDMSMLSCGSMPLWCEVLRKCSAGNIQQFASWLVYVN